MPKFLVTVTGYRQYVVDADTDEDAALMALEDAHDLHWQAEDASADIDPLNEQQVERAIAHGADEL